MITIKKIIIVLLIVITVLCIITGCRQNAESEPIKNNALSNNHQDITLKTSAVSGAEESSPLASRAVSEMQPEPIKGAFSIDFVNNYISERLQDRNNIPCFRETDLINAPTGLRIGSDSGVWSASSGFRPNLFEKIVSILPGPALREINNYIYLIYDSDKDTRWFMFFSKEKDGCMFSDGYPIIMKKKLSFNDFSQLEAGDYAIEVENIDPVMSLYITHYSEMSDESLKYIERKGRYLTSVHLLSDGIMKIEYERVDSGYVIKNIIYNPDFILDGANGRTCYKILDEDYVS